MTESDPSTIQHENLEFYNGLLGTNASLLQDLDIQVVRKGPVG